MTKSEALSELVDACFDKPQFLQLLSREARLHVLNVLTDDPDRAYEFNTRCKKLCASGWTL